MPHLEMPTPNLPEGHPDKEFFNPIKKEAFEWDDENYDQIPDDVFDMLSRNDIEFLGKGTECLVLTLPDHPEKAISYSFENSYEDFDVLRAKTSFYTHKIFNILFPHNFPKIFAAFGADGDKNKGTVRERVFDAGYGGRKINHPFMKVHDFFRFVLGVRPEMFIDTNDQNFALSDDGDEYYVDLISSSGFGEGSIRKVLSGAEGRILEYMDKNRNAFGFTDDDISKVSGYIGRLREFEEKSQQSTP